MQRSGGGALGAGNLAKAEPMRREMRGVWGGAPPCSGLPPPRLLLTPLLQFEGRQLFPAEFCLGMRSAAA